MKEKKQLTNNNACTIQFLSNHTNQASIPRVCILSTTACSSYWHWVGAPFSSWHSVGTDRQFRPEQLILFKRRRRPGGGVSGWRVPSPGGGALEAACEICLQVCRRWCRAGGHAWDNFSNFRGRQAGSRKLRNCYFVRTEVNKISVASCWLTIVNQLPWGSIQAHRN
jgi:hypothetical protein